MGCSSVGCYLAINKFTCQVHHCLFVGDRGARLFNIVDEAGNRVFAAAAIGALERPVRLDHTVNGRHTGELLAAQKLDGGIYIMLFQADHAVLCCRHSGK